MTRRVRSLVGGLSVILLCASSGYASEAAEDHMIPFPEGIDRSSVLGTAIEDVIKEMESDGESGLLLERLAVLYHANGYVSHANEFYDKALLEASEPVDRGRINYLAAQLVKEKGDSKSALRYLEASVAAYGDYPLSQVALGDARFKAASLDKAREAYADALRLEDGMPQARIGLARIAERSGDSEAMVEELEGLLAEHPGNSAALAMLSQWYGSRGEGKRAYGLSQLIDYSSSAPDVDPWYEAVRDAIYDVQRLDFLFLDYFMVGKSKEALPYLERMERVDPGNPRCSRYRALMYLESGYYGRAVERLKQGLVEGGEPAVFYPLMVKALAFQGRPQEAEQVARKAVEVHGASGELCLEWGRLLVERNELAEAMAVLGQGLEAEPYNVELHLMNARVAMKRGELEAAKESLDMAYQLSPVDAEVLVRVALICMEAGRFADALPYLKQAHYASPYFGDAIELLSDAYFELGKEAYGRKAIDECLDLFDQSLELQANRDEVLSVRARIAFEAGRYERAVAALKDWMEVSGEKPNLLLAYGDAQARLGKSEAAVSSWEAALKKALTDPRHVSLVRHLKRRLGRE